MGQTYIIAEAGVNHNGSIQRARELVLAAKSCGADAVKFQTFQSGNLVSKKAAKAAYQKTQTAPAESQYEMLTALELRVEDYKTLILLCQEQGLEFLSSPFDEESADLLERLGVGQFKIPSGEITNFPFLRHVAKKGLPIILSTGMSTLGEVEEALDVLRAGGSERVSLLHCVTEYPAPIGEINLRAMLTMKTAFHVPVGYSDHTLGLEISLAAVALGASIIEKHFTLDRTMPGPDHQSSLEPEEFRRMVIGIRNVEKSLGSGIKKPAACEGKNIGVVRKSLVATVKIRKGDLIAREAIRIKRPGWGIQPKDLDQVLGRRAGADIEADDVLTWDKLK